MEEGRHSLYYANSSSIFQLSFHIDIATMHDFEQFQVSLRGKVGTGGATALVGQHNNQGSQRQKATLRHQGLVSPET